MRGTVLFGVMFVSGLLVLPRASATTVIPPTFEELADRADLVFVGKVVGTQAEWQIAAATNQTIFTMVEFRTEEILKGTAGSFVRLRFLGGTVGGTTLEVVGVPQFKPGDRVVLFVEGNGVQFCPVVGVYHGKFGVRKDESNRDIVFLHDGKPLRDVADIGAAKGVPFGPTRARSSVAAERKPMSLGEFKACIRSHLAQKTVP